MRLLASITIRTGQSWAHQMKLLGVILLAILSSALILYFNLSQTSFSGSSDGLDDSFYAPASSMANPTIAAKWLLSDNTPPPGPSNVSAKNNVVYNATYTTRNSRSKTSSQSKNESGGMHVCSCLSPSHDQHRKKSPKRLRWLHIPKTGTSFISTLWSYAASTKDRYIDLAINSHVCSLGDATSYSMYDFALMRRYPWEVYGAPNMINGEIKIDKDVPLGLVGGTQHGPLTPSLKNAQFASSQRHKRIKHKLKRWGSEIHDHNMTVLSFFRQPEERIVSAYYDSRHASGFPPEIWKELINNTLAKSPLKGHQCKINGKMQKSNTLKCFANFPGVAGCMARMLTGETCADGIGQKSGYENLPMAIDVILNHLDFVGLTDDWNESICQFHKLFAGKFDEATGKRTWVPPLQGEFSNVHKSTKKKNLGVKHLGGFVDAADTVVYEAVKLKFQRMVGDERCYRYMSWDELKEQQQQQQQAANNDGTRYDELPVFLKIDEDGNVCQPKSCSDLGKQCGEWDDGCGRTIICGMCNAGRTGLPSTWRVQCVEGECVDYCPPWHENGHWFLSDDDDDDNASSPIKAARKTLGIEKQRYLSPADAVRICEMAPCGGSKGSAIPGLESLIADGLCKCGTTSETFDKNLALRDFSSAHDLNEMCRDNVARKGAVLMEDDTQPICCPYIHQKMNLTKGWKRLFTMGTSNLEGEYFDHVQIECGAFEECESVAREKEAEMAVFDMFNSMCYLARNVVDLGDHFTVTKDNQYRFIVDLR